MKNDLHILWSVRHEQWSMSQLSERMSLSQKQVQRKLKQWAQEGWIHYIPGKGRGNLSKVEWKENLEDHLLSRLNEAFQRNEFSFLNDLELSYFSEMFQQKVTSLFVRHIEKLQHNEEDLLYIPIYSKEPNLHPHKFRNTESGWILSHIYSRIVVQNDLQTFEGDLVHFWECRNQTVTFYMRPRMMWHDCTTITVHQVIHSIQAAFQLQKFHSFVNKFICIQPTSTNSFSITYSGSQQELLELLSQLEFSIIHPTKALIGTGPYEVEWFEANKLQLRAYEKYHLVQPFIYRVQFLTIPSTLQRKIQLSNHGEMKVMVELAGIFSAYIKPDSTLLKESENYEYVIQILKGFGETIHKIDPLKVPLIRKTIQFTASKTLACFKIGYVVNQSKFVKGLEAFCNAHELNVEIIKFDVHQELDIDVLLRNVDVLIMGEFPEGRLKNNYPLKLHVSSAEEGISRIPLYKSYREMYYPTRFRKSVKSIFGYPNLASSWLI